MFERCKKDVWGLTILVCNLTNNENTLLRCGLKNVMKWINSDQLCTLHKYNQRIKSYFSIHVNTYLIGPITILTINKNKNCQ